MPPIGTAGGIVGRWFGNAISEATAFAAGIAIGPVLGPPVQALKNETWKAYPNVPPDAGTMAAGVAQGQVDPAQAATWAKEHGFSQTAFDALVNVANTGPPLGLAYEAWRRGLMSDGEFTTALKRTGLEPQWDGALRGLHDRLLTSEELAMMQQQGFVDVARANSEGGQQGVTPERQQLRFEVAGLPPGVVQGLEMLRRGIIDQATFEAIVREGHTKIKYTAALSQLKTHVLSNLQYVEARVRGWINNSEMYAGGALTGWSQQDLDLLHKTHGRPISWHQVFIGTRRGGKRLDPTADMTAASTGIDPDFFAALQQSNIQQQWYDLAWAQRYTYPAAFVLRTLATSGDLTQAETEQILLYEGWEPTLAAKVSAKWAGSTGTTAAQKKQTLAHLTDEYLSGSLSRPALTTALLALGYTAQQAADEIALAEFNASKAVRTKATTAIGKRFIALQLSEAEARADMAALGWPTGAVDKFVAGWNAERDDEGTTLTQKQVLTAFKKGTLTAADALARLTVLGSSAADAQLLLDSQ